MLKWQKAQDKEKILKIAEGGEKNHTLCIEQQIQELHRTSLQKPNNKEESEMKYISYWNKEKKEIDVVITGFEPET